MKGVLKCKKTASMATIILVTILIVGTVPLQSRNRVIVRDFTWKILPFGNIDIYHYADSKPIMANVVEFLDDAVERNAFLGTTSDYRIPFFLYSSQNDFEQSTIATITEGVGGLAEVFKNRLLVGHTGSMRWLNYVTAHEYAHAVQFATLFSGFWRSARFLKFPFYPLWLMEGSAEYVSGDLDIPTREMYVRDSVLSNRVLSLKQLHNFAHLEPHQITLAYKTSELLMHFIAEEYGRDKIRELLVVYREYFDANTVLRQVIGMDLSMLDFKFREFLEERYERYKTKALSGERLTQNTIYSTFNTSPVTSPDGGVLYFVSDKRGRNEIWRQDIKTGRQTILVGLKNNFKIEHINPDLCISPDGNLIAFIGERNQKDFILTYDITQSALKGIAPNLNYSSLSSPSFFPDGEHVAVSAMVNGIRDVYKVSLNNGATRALTSDIHNDTDCSVSPDGKYVLYASERQKTRNFWDYDIYIAEVESGITKKLTNFEWDEISPTFSKDGKSIYFVAEPDTIRNIYEMEIESGKITKLTDTGGGCFDPFISRDGVLFYSHFQNGRKHIYRMNVPADDFAAHIPSIVSDEVGFVDEQPAKQIASRRYGFRASTDIFYPFIHYSSLDGLFLASYWQFSEMLGHHNIRTGVLYSGHDRELNYDIRYVFSKYRTSLIVGLTGDTIHYDRINNRIRRYDEILLGINYPLDRFRSIDIWSNIVFNRTILQGSETMFRDDIFGLRFTHNTVTRKFLAPISGIRYRLGADFATEAFGGATRAQNYFQEILWYNQIYGEHVLYMRNLIAGGFDRDAWTYSLGGRGRVRGYSYGDYISEVMMINNMELRVPIVSNINYHMWFMFPDFYFKSFFGYLFADGGQGFTRSLSFSDQIYSWGGGLKLYSFILQSFPLVFKLEYAKPFSPEGEKWYFSLGGHFF